MWWLLLACGGDPTLDTGSTGDSEGAGTDTGDSDSGSGLPGADVVGVSVSGSEGDWTFAVTLLSDDVDCSHYADWWEVVDQDGELAYRRVLNHSHADEQPFTRDGGSVAISGEETVWVRGHQNDRGYVGAVMTGSVQAGFVEGSWPSGLGEGLEEQEPLPEDCWW